LRVRHLFNLSQGDPHPQISLLLFFSGLQTNFGGEWVAQSAAPQCRKTPPNAHPRFSPLWQAGASVDNSAIKPARSSTHPATQGGLKKGDSQGGKRLNLGGHLFGGERLSAKVVPAEPVQRRRAPLQCDLPPAQGGHRLSDIGGQRNDSDITGQTR